MKPELREQPGGRDPLPPPLFFIGVLQHEDGVVDLQGWT